MLLPLIDRRDMNMTKVIFATQDYGLMFDCMNHASDHDVCTTISTLCNVLVEACFRFDKDFKPTKYGKGHVRIDLKFTDDNILAVFNAVMGVMYQLQSQHPKHMKIY